MKSNMGATNHLRQPELTGWGRGQAFTSALPSMGSAPLLVLPCPALPRKGSRSKVKLPFLLSPSLSCLSSMLHPATIIFHLDSLALVKVFSCADSCSNGRLCEEKAVKTPNSTIFQTSLSKM